MRRGAAVRLLLGTSLLLGPGCLTAAEGDAPVDPAAVVLASLAAANQARHDLARERAAWELERQRLQALITATSAEGASLQQEAASAQAQADAATTRLEALGHASDLDAVRLRLRQAGDTLTARLAMLAATQVAGVVPAASASAPGASDANTFDAAMHALEASERAAGAVSVEVVSGMRDGGTVAVKLLRIAGAAWWVALDGSAAGVVHPPVPPSQLQLVPTLDPRAREAILRALAQAESRAPAGVVLLPWSGSP